MENVYMSFNIRCCLPSLTTCTHFLKCTERSECNKCKTAALRALEFLTAAIAAVAFLAFSGTPAVIIGVVAAVAFVGLVIYDLKHSAKQDPNWQDEDPKLDIQLGEL